ncbi:cation diffusion facilitator family transporter [Methanolobus sp. ZRKC3]|uniref:cation diffusion facilitator family transporter n=1 Tax=Methanolobus sp. ZRKC3 TaxID=3125786 RepID=UPI003249F498
MDSRFRKMQRIMFYVLFLNLAVAFAKLAYGMLTNVLSMQSDGYHSLFDGVSNIIGLVGIQIASKPPDKEHPYGHRKFETIASIFIAVLLGIVAFEIVHSAFERFGNGSSPEVTIFSFAVMIATMAVNFAVTTYERKNGEKLNSDVLIADAAHTKSDIYVSLSVILGLAVIKAGYPLVDPIISILVAIVILHAGIQIIFSSVSILCDESRIDPDDICSNIDDIEGIMGCHNIRTRGSQGNIFVDLHIQVDPEMSTYKSHKLAHIVQYRLKERFEGVEEVLVHIEPSEEQ